MGPSLSFFLFLWRFGPGRVTGFPSRSALVDVPKLFPRAYRALGIRHCFPIFVMNFGKF